MLAREALDAGPLCGAIFQRGHAPSGAVQDTSITSSSAGPAGRCTSTTSPGRFPSRARPSGASTLMRPAATSSSSGPTSR